MRREKEKQHMKNEVKGGALRAADHIVRVKQ